MPRSGRVGLLMMIGLQNKIAGGEQDFLHVGILPDFFARDGDDELVKFALPGEPVFHPPAFKRHPGDAHDFHVLFREVAGVFGVKGGALGDLFARVSPVESGKCRARVVGAFGIFHHLPETFEAGVALAVKRERRRRKIGKQSKLVALG